jgi:hypothetical protein
MTQSFKLNLLRYEGPSGFEVEEDGGLMPLDYSATLHAGADAIETGIPASTAAAAILDMLPEDDDRDGLHEAAQELGPLAPLGSLAKLCRALANLDSYRDYMDMSGGGYDTKAVEELVAQAEAGWQKPPLPADPKAALPSAFRAAAAAGFTQGKALLLLAEIYGAATEIERDAAIALHATDDIEIDDEPLVSRHDDTEVPDGNGAWVAAWLWVPAGGGA